MSAELIRLNDEEEGEALPVEKDVFTDKEKLKEIKKLSRKEALRELRRQEEALRIRMKEIRARQKAIKREKKELYKNMKKFEPFLVQTAKRYLERLKQIKIVAAQERIYVGKRGSYIDVKLEMEGRLPDDKAEFLNKCQQQPNNDLLVDSSSIFSLILDEDDPLLSKKEPVPEEILQMYGTVAAWKYKFKETPGVTQMHPTKYVDGNYDPISGGRPYFMVPREKDLGFLDDHLGPDKAHDEDADKHSMIFIDEKILRRQCIPELYWDSAPPPPKKHSLDDSSTIQLDDLADKSNLSLHTQDRLRKMKAKKLQKAYEKCMEPEKFFRDVPDCRVLRKNKNLKQRIAALDGSDAESELVFDAAHLDYAMLMNVLDGNWGVDEDAMIAQFFFKFIHDQSWRDRIKMECHNLLDECDCPVHEKITNEKLMNLGEAAYFEIETEADRKDVVERLKKEFREAYNKENNMELERLMYPSKPDSDEETDTYYAGEPVPPPEKIPEIHDFDKPKDWLTKVKQTTPTVQPQFVDRPHSEEALLRRIGYREAKPARIQRLRMKDLVKVKDKKNIEQVVEDLYVEKTKDLRDMENKQVKWRPKKAYAYKRPDWKQPLPVIRPYPPVNQDPDDTEDNI